MRAAAITALLALAACGSGAVSPDQGPQPISAFARQQAETVARHMLADTYNATDAAPVANCARNLASDAQVLALIDAPRDQARAVFAELYARPAMRSCIAQSNVTWRELA